MSAGLIVFNPADGTLTYTYDGNGNILTVSQNNTVKLTYTYDSLNQLVREDNAYSNESYTYSYDIGGNITSKSTYAYTTGTLGNATDTVSYTYGDSSWSDLLTSYDGSTITYDTIGNPLSYNGWTFTWQRGRQLASASKGTDSISYVYNDDGIRTSKTVNNVTTNYFLDSNNKVIGEQNITNTLWYYYDANNKLVGFELNCTPYYYTRNAQGDITAIVNSSGNVVAKYTYDAWGNIISMTDGNDIDISSNTTHVGYLNPYRYRSYRYDNETGLYYLQSRYYNPSVGRFINADIFTDTGTSIIGTNMFAYCDNNPVNKIDNTGYGAVDEFMGLLGNSVEVLQFLLKMIQQTYARELKSLTNTVKRLSKKQSKHKKLLKQLDAQIDHLDHRLQLVAYGFIAVTLISILVSTYRTTNQISNAIIEMLANFVIELLIEGASRLIALITKAIPYIGWILDPLVGKIAEYAIRRWFTTSRIRRISSAAIKNVRSYRKVTFRNICNAIGKSVFRVR